MSGPAIGSLCSGYGGLDMAAMDALGGTVAWHAETDPAARLVLDAHWPGTPDVGDITRTDWSAVQHVDVITAGYPCQPESDAGHRRSTQDERWIWPAVADAVRHLRPRLVLLENVSGHVGRGLPTVLGDLAGLGYVGSCLPASAVGAPHQRLRVFIAASADPGRDAWAGDDAHRPAPARGGAAPADTNSQRRERPGYSWRRQRGPAHGPSADADGHRRDEGRAEPAGQLRESHAALRDGVDWGRYTPAVARWERILGRPAPAPTVPGRTGGPVLNPELPEWMLGLPAGWVTAVPGISRTAQLRILGNGVCPRQGAVAFRALLTGRTP